jgi:hypothetical protein
MRICNGWSQVKSASLARHKSGRTKEGCAAGFLFRPGAVRRRFGQPSGRLAVVRSSLLPAMARAARKQAELRSWERYRRAVREATAGFV